MIKMIFFLNFYFFLFYQNWAVIAREWILLNFMTHLKNSPHKNAIFDVKNYLKKKELKSKINDFKRKIQ